MHRPPQQGAAQQLGPARQHLQRGGSAGSLQRGGSAGSGQQHRLGSGAASAPQDGSLQQHRPSSGSAAAQQNGDAHGGQGLSWLDRLGRRAAQQAQQQQQQRQQQEAGEASADQRAVQQAGTANGGSPRQPQKVASSAEAAHVLDALWSQTMTSSSADRVGLTSGSCRAQGACLHTS